MRNHIDDTFDALERNPEFACHECRRVGQESVVVETGQYISGDRPVFHVQLGRQLLEHINRKVLGRGRLKILLLVFITRGSASVSGRDENYRILVGLRSAAPRAGTLRWQALPAFGTDEIIEQFEGRVFGKFLQHLVLQLLIGECQEAHGLCQVGRCDVSERLGLDLKHCYAPQAGKYTVDCKNRAIPLNDKIRPCPR